MGATARPKNLGTKIKCPCGRYDLPLASRKCRFCDPKTFYSPNNYTAIKQTS